MARPRQLPQHTLGISPLRDRFHPKTAGDFSLIDDGNTVGDGGELIQVFGNEEYGTPPLALLQEQSITPSQIG
jgi:hypothetical protein